MEVRQSPYRILIVNDPPANISVLGNVMKSDYELKVATNGSDGLPP